ncbi:hypothetical protein RA307_07195 [Xanthobacteraceae bacterium Astr-EGSB]|uniref:hypothetical protein n=1 Tax=Astrobacterium formosum TaxID=3069710 RepID=UPI0027AF8F30|nr:hypothetical protein [Xanthobacteraceae bacterium Astr-EGSB]
MTVRFSLVPCAAAVVIAMAATPCFAGGAELTANDTGGMISWSPAIASVYRHIAAEHCARFDKLAVITSVHRRYGDYVGFRCFFPRGYDPRRGMVAARRPIRTLY